MRSVGGGDSGVTSHIKPRRDSNHRERLDPYTGLMLAPAYDAAFDAGFITFEEPGTLVLSPRLAEHVALSLGISPDGRLIRVDPRHLPYLAHHRTDVFKGGTRD